MRIFHITSNIFNGYVELKFNDSEVFAGIDFSESDINIKQQKWFMEKIPANVRALGIFKIEPEVLTVTEVVQELTFDMFWKRYDDRISSSKKKTLAKWNKMSAAEQAKAYRHIHKYFSSIPSGTRKKYAETYLNAELWNN